jgi:hypothetical protein
VKLTTYLHLVLRSKYEWRYTPTPQYAFMAWFSVKKHRDNFTFTSYFILARVQKIQEKSSLIVAAL